jgi:signal transduction histidine kinase/CheY-like chemotaxis protein
MNDQFSYEELSKKIKELESEISQKDEIINEIKSRSEELDFKRLEKELQKTKEKALSSEKFKSAFLANMSHAVRTPMNAIIGFSELIAMESISPKRKEEYIRIINEKGHQLLTLIDDIIEISKIEAGRFEINYTPVNLDEFLNEIFSITFQRKIKAGKDAVDLILQKNPTGEPLLIQTDPGRLQQIFYNILGFNIYNTLKGEIEFGYTLKDTRTIEFYIKDTGMGLNKDDQKLIFNYFWQFEDISHQRLSGIGLGLTIAKKIIELLGGKVSLISELNKGTYFSFTLPIEKPSKLKVEEKHNSNKITLDDTNMEPNWKDKVILVVEDDEINYQFIEALVEKTQAQLLHASDGFQALELCKTINKIDLILMDIKLPEKNGFQVTKEIKQIKNEIPIIAHTAFTLTEIKDKCLEAGCVDVIIKPIEIPLFFSKVNKYLQDI